MYLAPLNYDRYFKKVFSDLKIAKRFLEDFLNVTIEEIEFLKNENKITDDAQSVEFDFRCKIDNNHVIIEMQQWYKPDVIQRFYVYHALSAALQLERMPKKLISLPDGKTRKVHDYSELLPTITIIWMVHDSLNFTDDYVSFILTPEYITDFIKESRFWNKNNCNELLNKRQELYENLVNKSKNVDFLSKNRLIYAFQKNIVKNKLYSKYYNWFELAEKTLKKISDKFEFDIYTKDEILVEVIRRLKKSLTEEDSEKYIKNYEEFIDGVLRYDKGIEKNVRNELQPIIDNERKEKEQAQKEKGEALKKLKKIIYKMHQRGSNEKEIAEELEISEDEVKKLLETHELKN